MSFHLLALNVSFELISGVVALLVSYYAFHYNRLIENSTLKYISFGFMLLGMGLLAETLVESLVTFNIGDIYAQRFLALGTATIYDFLEMAAYFVFAFGYVRTGFSTPTRQVAGAVAQVVANDKRVRPVEGTSGRGLASAPKETRDRVAKAGGQAPHKKRGLEAVLPEVRSAIARKGGLARGRQRRQEKEKSLSVQSE